jgi:hypothetical protein
MRHCCTHCLPQAPSLQSLTAAPVYHPPPPSHLHHDRHGPVRHQGHAHQHGTAQAPAQQVEGIRDGHHACRVCGGGDGHIGGRGRGRGVTDCNRVCASGVRLDVSGSGDDLAARNETSKLTGPSCRHKSILQHDIPSKQCCESGLSSRHSAGSMMHNPS